MGAAGCGSHRRKDLGHLPFPEASPRQPAQEVALAHLSVILASPCFLGPTVDLALHVPVGRRLQRAGNTRGHPPGFLSRARVALQCPGWTTTQPPLGASRG